MTDGHDQSPQPKGLRQYVVSVSPNRLKMRQRNIEPEEKYTERSEGLFFTSHRLEQTTINRNRFMVDNLLYIQ